MKRSSIVLLFISLWWIIPLFIRDLLAYPILSNFNSHLLYLLVITISITCSITLGFIDDKKELWNRYDFWGKYLIAMCAYAAQMILLLTSVFILDSFRLIRYYGGDAGGSVVLLFFPSIVIYFVIGGTLGIIFAAIKWKRRTSNLKV